MRIIQITDTHLSRSKAHFADNWAPLARWIAAQRPDLVIHTGDVKVDGVEGKGPGEGLGEVADREPGGLERSAIGGR